MARPSLAYLISRVRTMVNDTSVAAPVFPDSVYENVLDESRIEVRHAPLWPRPTFVVGGAVQYLDFYSAPGLGWFEADVVLQAVDYTDISATCDLAELDVGHFHWPTQPVGFSVRLTGKSFDPYAAAASLLDRWVAAVALQFDFMGGEQRFMRSQQQAQLRALAQQYRQQALPRSGHMRSHDLVPEGLGGSPAVVYPSYAGGY